MVVMNNRKIQRFRHRSTSLLYFKDDKHNDMITNTTTTTSLKPTNPPPSLLTTPSNTTTTSLTPPEKTTQQPPPPPPFSTQLPPLIVEDAQLLFFDIILLLNLSVGISTLVLHRHAATNNNAFYYNPFLYVSQGFSEGSLLATLWILSGLYHGSFLYSAVDGHMERSSEDESSRKAGMLAFNTFVSAMNGRILLLLVQEVFTKRGGGMGGGGGDDLNLIFLELGFGLVLMTFWRVMHSRSVPRI